MFPPVLKALTKTAAAFGPISFTTASLLLTLLFGALRFFVFTSAGAENSLLDLRELSSFVFLWNLFQFLFTAIPMRYRVVCPGLDSDGRQILTLLRERKDDKKAQ